MRIALLGMGTVGSGVYELLSARSDMQIKRILDRRTLGEAEPLRTQSYDEILSDAQIDTVVELLGGVEPAYSFALRALQAGKNVVSANKLMISSDMRALTEAARANKVQLRISASVGGGIPYLHNLLRARSVDTLVEISGIVNGTTNLILDTMQRKQVDFDTVLSRAQAEGYAEADPSADIDGIDARSKLSLAASVAFNAFVTAAEIPTAGIRMLKLTDVAQFHAMGRVCRLIVHASLNEKGLCAYVEPTLVLPNTHEAAITENGNFTRFVGKNIGEQALIGQGAGKLPTASAVVADLVDIASGAAYLPYVSSDKRLPVDGTLEAHRYYVRTSLPLPFKCEQLAPSIFITAPVTVAEMHDAMRADRCAFFAGIRDEG